MNIAIVNMKKERIADYAELYMSVALVITIGVNIAEVIILKRLQKLTALYLMLSVILLRLPYLVYILV